MSKAPRDAKALEKGSGARGREQVSVQLRRDDHMAKLMSRRDNDRTYSASDYAPEMCKRKMIDAKKAVFHFAPTTGNPDAYTAETMEALSDALAELDTEIQFSSTSERYFMQDDIVRNICNCAYIPNMSYKLIFNTVSIIETISAGSHNNEVNALLACNVLDILSAIVRSADTDVLERVINITSNIAADSKTALETLSDSPLITDVYTLLMTSAHSIVLKQNCARTIALCMHSPSHRMQAHMTVYLALFVGMLFSTDHEMCFFALLGLRNAMCNPNSNVHVSLLQMFTEENIMQCVRLVGNTAPHGTMRASIQKEALLLLDSLSLADGTFSKFLISHDILTLLHAVIMSCADYNSVVHAMALAETATCSSHHNIDAFIRSDFARQCGKVKFADNYAVTERRARMFSEITKVASHNQVRELVKLDFMPDIARGLRTISSQNHYLYMELVNRVMETGTFFMEVTDSENMFKRTMVELEIDRIIEGLHSYVDSKESTSLAEYILETHFKKDDGAEPEAPAGSLKYDFGVNGGNTSVSESALASFFTYAAASRSAHVSDDREDIMLI